MQKGFNCDVSTKIVHLQNDKIIEEWIRILKKVFCSHIVRKPPENQQNEFSEPSCYPRHDCILTSKYKKSFEVYRLRMLHF